jgi:iron complex transport system ATP-binding protein
MMLALKDLTCGYGRTAILSDVSLDVSPGESLCLLGPNGCGKTTLLRTILGLLAPLAGEVLVDDVSIARLPRRHRARLLAYVPQAHALPFPFRVLDVVLTGRSAHVGMTATPSRADEQAACAALERMGCADLAGRTFTQLSGGEQQLVLIARALAQDARILIMDEPSSNLDFGNQARLLAIMRSIVAESDLAVVMTTHYPNHAFAIASHVALIKDGRVMDSGHPDHVLTEQSLGDTYGVPVRILETETGRQSRLRVAAAAMEGREW